MATLSSVLTEFLGDDDPECMLTWPPDAFAVTSRIMELGDFQRRIVSPPPGCKWANATEWSRQICKGGKAWAAFCDRDWITKRAAGDKTAGLKSTRTKIEPVTKRFTALLAKWIQGKALEGEWGDTKSWNALQAIVALHAMADEACNPHLLAGKRSRRFFEQALRIRIAGGSGALGSQTTGSLATFSPSLGSVLPKSHTPQVGLTLRSSSLFLAYHRHPARIQWMKPYAGSVAERSWEPGGTPAGEGHFTVLLFPWPYIVQASSFRPRAYDASMPDKFGYFEYASGTSQDDTFLRVLRGVLEEARREIGGEAVDLLVLPEASVTISSWDHAMGSLRVKGEQFPFRSYIVGCRSENSESEPTNLQANFARIGFLQGGEHAGHDYRDQHKHHRWRIDRGQVQCYNLGHHLNASKIWWEGIRIEDRVVTFAEPLPGLSVCPLICEALARQDPLAGVLRTVGPSLVICLLMDGPQLISRWSAKYASVLADDPGSSVLTLTCKGMLDRWSSPHAAHRDVVALWRDSQGTTQELELLQSDALLLRVRLSKTQEHSIDGRMTKRDSLILDGVTRVRRATRS